MSRLAPTEVQKILVSRNLDSTVLKASSRKGHSTTDSLLYMLQEIYEAVDGGQASARIFFVEFLLIDHSILMQELADLEVHPILLSWITAFLTYREQAVRIGRTLSDWLTLMVDDTRGVFHLQKNPENFH